MHIAFSDPALSGERAMREYRRYILAVSVLLAMALVGAIGYLSLPKTEILLPPADHCRLDRQACASALPGGGRIELSIEPLPVPTARPLTLYMRLAGIRPEKVSVDFTGVGMNMGVTRLSPQTEGGGIYSGQVTLPVCVTGSMMWQATVRLETAREVLAIPFRFESRHG
jgi:hypothetical protein